MRRMVQILIAIILVVSVMVACVACSGGVKAGTVALPHYDGISESEEYNHNLFYRNDLTVNPYADPGAVYVTEGEQAGYFYVYGTSDAISTGGIMCYRSKNLNDWECMGCAFTPGTGAWGRQSLWAPEVLYSNGKYYMYYSATNIVKTSDPEGIYNNFGAWKGVGIAVSDNPQGPFVEYEGTNADGRVVTAADQAIDFRWAYLQDEHVLDGVTDKGWQDMYFIDANPFVDEDGALYMYFCAHDWSAGLGGGTSGSFIFGVKMKDPVTPDYATAARITTPNKLTTEPDSADCEIDKMNVNEAPEMIKHNGKYYLTYSTSRWFTSMYSVNVAVSDNPLNGFVKQSDPVMITDVYCTNVAGTGHHCFVPANGETYVVYHELIDRNADSGNVGKRAIAVDRMVWITQADGGKYEFDELRVLGPTYSIQPGIENGYVNVANKATVSVKNAKDESLVKRINDGIFSVLAEDSERMDFTLNKGKSSVTLIFNEPTTVRGVLVYTGSNFETAFRNLSSVYFENKSEILCSYDGKSVSSAIIEGLKVNPSYFEMDDAFINGGAAALAEFDEISVTKIVFEFNSETEITFSDIVVLGK